MAVKLYEKDPSKLTAMDEPLPNLSTGSDISDDEDSNQAIAADIKEEPLDVTTVDEEPAAAPEAPRPVWGAPGGPGGPGGGPGVAGPTRERHSFSSGQEEPSDSDTVSHLLFSPAPPFLSSTSPHLHFSKQKLTVLPQELVHALKCRHCSNTYQDMKSLQIHNFLEHQAVESPPPHQPAQPPPPPQHSHQLPLQPQPQRPPPHPAHHPPPPLLPLGCHICGASLPSQAAFQQVEGQHVCLF